MLQIEVSVLTLPRSQTRLTLPPSPQTRATPPSVSALCPLPWASRVLLQVQFSRRKWPISAGWVLPKPALRTPSPSSVLQQPFELLWASCVPSAHPLHPIPPLIRKASSHGPPPAFSSPADLTLDPGTAHRRLLVSADRRSVRLAPPGTPAPRDSPGRFDQLPAVLGAQGFRAGRHCWEVEIADTASRGDSSGEDEDDGESRYALGVAGESVRRKGRVGLCPAEAVWAVEDRGGRLWALTAPEPTPLGGAGPQPRRIRVDLHWERGRVAFYDGCSLDLLFAFQAPGPLGERVFPLLCTRDPRVPLCLVPAEG